MGNEKEANAPSQLPTPARASPTQLAIDAQSATNATALDTLGTNRNILPQYAQLFTNIEAQQAPQRLNTFLTNEAEGRPKLIDIALQGLKQADPTGFVLSEEVKQRVLGNLRAGGNLTPEESRALDQGVQSRLLRQGRGTGVGDAYSAERLFANERFGREQARIQNAMQVLANDPQSRLALGINTPFFQGAQGTDPFITRPIDTSQAFGAGLAQNQGAISDAQLFNQGQLQRAQFSKTFTSPNEAAGLAGVAAGVIGTGVGAAFGTNGFGGALGGLGGGSNAPTIMPSAYGGVGQPNAQTIAFAAPRGATFSGY